MNSAPQVMALSGGPPNWATMDALMRSIEFYELFEQLGIAPPIWHITDRFQNRIQSSLGRMNVEWAGRAEAARDCSVISLHDPDEFGLVTEEVDTFLTRRAKGAQNTHDFDEVIQLLRKLRKSLINKEPIRGSMITDLLDGMWLGRNWDGLPEQLNKRRVALDGVLRDICLAIERPTAGGFNLRPLSLSKAASAYIDNDWMHTKWLTTLIAREMLSELGSTMEKSSKAYSKGMWTSLAAGLVLGYLWDQAVGIMLGAVGLWALAMGIWVSCTGVKIEQIANELRSGHYDGGVLADRIERFNRRFGCRIPSVLTGVLRAQPARGNSNAVGVRQVTRDK